MKLDIQFTEARLPDSGLIVLLCDKAGVFTADTQNVAGFGAIERAIDAAKWSGGHGKTLDVWVPEGAGADRIMVAGIGDVHKTEADRWARVGGKVATSLGNADAVSILADGLKPAEYAALAMGMKLAAYKFDRYMTKADKDETNSKQATVTIHVDSEADAKAFWKTTEPVAEGALLARDLVDEPANILTPVRFAARMETLSELGCKVTILDHDAMQALDMNALLGVSRGSRNPPRMAIVEWNGGKKGDRPVAFVGKGVTFDTGGISIKPSAGMEDMKGDMGGAAAVAGLMHALAGRKAKANVVGIVALVENMPDGDAQRPGDIVVSKSGQTIEIINTDAEGRLVLADALTHCIETFDPKFVIDLATLTGAILVALGNHHAGLFSNDDSLAEQITAAGIASNEKVWRLPIGPEYDKLIDTKNADMKNTGGRYAGSITAAQFLKRFVGETPWAHLDIAGTAMGSPKTEISTGWASGFGVRLLNELVAAEYEN